VPGLLFQYELTPDGRGRFLYVSERGGQLFGLQVPQVMDDINVLFATIEVDDRRLMLQALRESAATLGEWRCEFSARRADGQQRMMLGTATPEKLDGGRMVWHGYVEDVTERQQLDQARRDAAVAEAANRAKTEFLSRMSHELRTPLNAVLGFTQLMEIDQTEPPGPGQQRRLKLMREAGEHLLHMINDMLDLTRIESGGLKLQAERVTLGELAAQTLELVRDLAGQQQVQLLLTVPTGAAEPVVHADRTRLRQVLLNLLANAIKYNRPGGHVTLHVRLADDGRAEIVVTDTGVGIAAEELPQVFEPFQRGRQSGSTVEGAGIGLAVTRSLVLLMGGEISADSTPGVGSVFSVRLPVAGSGATAADAFDRGYSST
jgi:hypothetical protein